jgi:type II secretory pathway pseudopilin PulG
MQTGESVRRSTARDAAGVGRRGERGHLMAALMAAVAVLMILTLVGGQAWSEMLRREREAEMMFRAQEIARAIARFQKDQGALPVELDQLMQPGNRRQYFLRRMYADPLAPDGKWLLLRAGPDGSVIDPSQAGEEETGAGRGFGSSRRTGRPQRGASSGTATGETAGLPIVGVKSRATGQAFRVWRGQSDYSQWLFTIYDLQTPETAGVPGQPSGGRPSGPGRPGDRR